MTTVSSLPAPRSPEGSSMRRQISWMFLALTSLGVAVYFPGSYAEGSLATLAREGTGLASTYADRPWPIQLAFYAHITFAGLALLLGPWQFSARLRRRAPVVHRWIGRSYVTAVIVGGVAAFVMSFASSVGLLGFFGFGSLAVLWVGVTAKAWSAIRARDVDAHQAWMIRSFALTYAAPTLRAWFLLLIGVQLLVGLGGPGVVSNAYAPLPFLAWLPNIVVAEFVIRRRGLPGLRLQTTAEARSARRSPVPAGDRT